MCFGVHLLLYRGYHNFDKVGLIENGIYLYLYTMRIACRKQMRSKIYVSIQHMNAYLRNAEMKENFCLSKHHTQSHTNVYTNLN